MKYIYFVFQFFCTAALIVMVFFIGLFEGIFKSSLSYFKGFKYASYNKNSLKAREMFNEPAEEKYFFYKQYEDLKNIYKSASSINEGNIMLYRKCYGEDISIDSIRFKVTEASIYVFGNVFNSICFIIHFIVITLISIPVYVFYFLVMALEKMRLKRTGISTVCTHCYSKFEIPYYICPHCGSIHKNLVPGPYGIIKRKCKCGNKIETTRIGGRHKLSSICPVCSKEIRINESSPICISIVGNEAVGKTSFVYAAVDNLLNNISKNKKWNIRFLNSMEEESFSKILKNVNQGILPKKTSNKDKLLYNISISSERFSSDKLLYIYDNSEEDLNLKDSIISQKYYRYMDGIVFIIDALSLCGKEKDTDTNDLLDRFILSLRQVNEIAIDKPIHTPIVVVVNKMDLLNYKGSTLAFLKEMGEEKIIRKIQYNFLNYEFFSSSILKASEEGVTYNGDNAIEPVNWILSRANKELV